MRVFSRLSLRRFAAVTDRNYRHNTGNIANLDISPCRTIRPFRASRRFCHGNSAGAGAVSNGVFVEYAADACLLEPAGDDRPRSHRKRGIFLNIAPICRVITLPDACFNHILFNGEIRRAIETRITDNWAVLYTAAGYPDIWTPRLTDCTPCCC